jgi:hypothetical protein
VEVDEWPSSRLGCHSSDLIGRDNAGDWAITIGDLDLGTRFDGSEVPRELVLQFRNTHASHGHM